MAQEEEIVAKDEEKAEEPKEEEPAKEEASEEETPVEEAEAEEEPKEEEVTEDNGNSDLKTEDLNSLSEEQEKNIIDGISEKIENKENFTYEVSQQIRKQVSDNLKAENIDNYEAEADRIMTKVDSKISEVVSKEPPKPAVDTRTDEEVLAALPQPLQASLEKIATVAQDYLNKEASLTCNKYISSMPKPQCTSGHLNLFGL